MAEHGFRFKPWTRSAEDKAGAMDVSELETLAWQRARTRRLIEMGAAIVSGGVLVTMVTIFYRILTRT